MLCVVRKILNFSPTILEASKKFLVNLAVISLICEQFIFISASTAKAADLPITPDGSTNTQIDRAANGVPIVNIAAPNSGGLSHNKFENYNVNPSGLILNNATGDQNGIIQTQIGGLINDNANLKNSGAASVILNEVTSNNISQINGYTEIAGKKADLVLANPNGFVFNGSGFINVSKFTAVVGSSNQFNPNPNDLTFRLSDNAYAVTHGFLPKLTIMGAGIDLENITSTDLVANVMNIVAPVYGGTNDVNLRTGDQTFNYLTKAVTSDNTTPGSNLPDEVAIDASALGKIQAGRIFIIATKEGFGIKYSGDLLASRAGITIDNQGNIDYNNALSEVGDISVTSHKGSITQNGTSWTKDAASDIKLNAFGNIANYGQFVSARNINLETTSGNFRNETSLVSLSDNDFTIKAVDFTNLGQIAANRDLNIEAGAITNSSKLVAGRNLILTAPQITNEDSIYANNKITITASNYLTNNKDIISLGEGLTLDTADDGINIVAKTLNNNKQIAAKNNITINSNSLNNNTANSTILAFNNINLNAISVDNSNASIAAAGNFILRNLTLNSPTIASNFGVTSQATSITNTGGTFYAGTLLDFDLGNVDYTIIGTHESSGNIKIKANNITNQSNVKAEGAIQIEANNQFFNGSLLGDNSNIRLVAGTALSVTAANLLSNYGTLSSKTDLTLTSTNNDINNNANAEIIGGTGKLTLSAKNGTVYQNSLHSIVANGDYSLDVTDFVNTGRVDVAGNLTLNVANNLTNEAAAMIYAGGTMELNVVNNLTNNIGAVIYSEGNLTIQKYALTNPLYNAANNRINQLDNIASEITSYDGDMVIRATTINNKRNTDPGTWLIKPDRYVADPDHPGQLKAVAYYYTWGDGQYDLKFTNHDLYSWQWLRDRWFGEGEHQIQYTATAPLNSDSRAATIFAGKTMTLDSVTILNDTSNILSASDLSINADTLTNQSKNYPELIYMATSGRHNEYTDNASDFASDFSPIALNSDALFSSLIKSGGSFYGTAFSKLSNITISPNYTKGNSTKFNQNTSDANTVLSGTSVSGSTHDRTVVNSLDVGEITQNGTINLNLTSYFNGPTDNGLFTKNPNPNGPLFESRSQFVDQSKYFGSDYFYQKIGLNLTDVQTQFELQNKRLVGDQFFQNKIISEQLATITKNSFLLSSSGTNTNNEIKSLLDNAADEYARLGLTYNQSLTQTQINNLQKDIVWFETKTIDGAMYIVPTIYLAQATRDAIKNGNIASKATIFAKDNVNITASDSITNNGSIIAGNNAVLSATNKITNNNFSDIIAGNGLSLTSSAGSIVNFSQLKATNALSLTAAKDITNSSTVLTSAANLLDSGQVGYVSGGMGGRSDGNIYSEVLETAKISAGTLTINAGNDFNNYAANITTTGNATITAGNNANFETLQLRNRTETSWGHASKGGSTIVDTTTNVASNVNVGGNLNVTTTGLAADAATDGGSNINIIGSNVSTTGNLSLAAKDTVNIASAIDTYHKEERSNSKSFSVKKTYEATTDNTTNVSSNLTSSGNINISSGKDTNIIASNLTSTGSGNILAGAYTDLDPLSATYGQTIYNDTANLNILSGLDTKRFYSESTKTKTGISLENAVMTAAMVAAVVATGGAGAAALATTGGMTAVGAGAAVGSVNKQKTTKTELHYDETVVSSKLKFGNDLTLSSMNDATLQAAKVEAGGNVTINAVNNLAIATATETHQTSYDLKDKGNYFFKNGQSGNYNTNVINTEITSNGGTNSNLTFNVGNATVAQYNKASGDNTNGVTKTGLDGSVLYGDFSGNSKLAYLDKLDSSTTLYNPVEEVSKSWDQTNRGLTKAGQAVVAITATALTMGAMDPVSGSWAQGALVAGSSAAASTAAISATNSAMNADGDIFKQLKTISKDTWDNTTSKESVKNIAIAAAAGGLAVGATNFVNTGSFAAPATATTNTVSSNASTLERVGTNLKNSFQDVAINTVASSAAQSAINGDSFADALKGQGKNILIYTAAKVAANEIGRAYHGTTDQYGNTVSEPTIGKPLQLTLHAGLGCAVGAASGGNCGSGAIAGVVGEQVAETGNKYGGFNQQTSIQLANLTGGIAAGTYGNLTGQSDEKNADNIWTGSRIGQNAAENNNFARDMAAEMDEKAWLEGKMSDADYRESQRIKLRDDKIEGNIALAALTLGDGIALYQGARAFAVGRGWISGASEATTSLSSGTDLIVHPFSEGATHITTDLTTAKFNQSLFAGNPSGMYVIPKSQADYLLSGQFSRTEIEQSLGLTSGQLSKTGNLVRVDVSNPFKYNLRMPDPATGNIYHLPNTARTPAGFTESVITPPLKGDPNVISTTLIGR